MVTIDSAVLFGLSSHRLNPHLVPKVSEELLCRHRQRLDNDNVDACSLPIYSPQHLVLVSLDIEREKVDYLDASNCKRICRGHALHIDNCAPFHEFFLVLVRRQNPA